MIRATLDEAVPLQLKLADGNTALYSDAVIYDSAGAVVTTVILPHVADGLYSATWAPDTEGHYGVFYGLYSDAERTVSVSDEYTPAGETIEVSSDKTNIMRLLGLMHENARIDDCNYTTDGRLQSARLRVWDSADNANAGGATGLLYEYEATSTFSGGLMSSYKILRVL